jgi:hypothetical protein
MREFDESKKTGLTDAETEIYKTVKQNYNTNISLAKKDPNQLAINHSMFNSILEMKGPDGGLNMQAVLKEMKFRTGQGALQMFDQYGTNGSNILSNEELNDLSEGLSTDPVGAFQFIRNTYHNIGQEQSNNIFKEMYPKKSNGIIYAAVLAGEKEKVATKIINGIYMIKEGAKLENDDKKELTDYFKTDMTINKFGKSAPGIRQSIEAYYYSMEEKDIDEAVRKVTNGIDNNILMYKELDEDGDIMSYSKVRNNMEDIIGDRLKTKLTNRLNGKPKIGIDTFRENFDDYELISVSSKGYTFKHKSTGDYLTTEDGGKLVFTFTKED